MGMGMDGDGGSAEEALVNELGKFVLCNGLEVEERDIAFGERVLHESIKLTASWAGVSNGVLRDQEKSSARGLSGDTGRSWAHGMLTIVGRRKMPCVIKIVRRYCVNSHKKKLQTQEETDLSPHTILAMIHKCLCK
jgi:hypothetical protein